jgi:hypothetical protein
MKPDWDKLMEEFADSPSQLVAEVDCTSDGGKPLCDANGVRGYPTLKWGDPAGLEDYSGQRDFESLKAFATENLKPICSPTHIDLCDPEHKAEIEQYMGLSMEDLQGAIKEKESEVEKIESDFKSYVEGLQSQYKQATKDKDAKIADIKSGGLTLMKKVEISKKKNTHDEL